MIAPALATACNIKPQRRFVCGFTLIEMAVVLIIVSIVMAGGLTIISRDLENERAKATNERMLYVQRAVEAFTYSFGYAPCPASVTAQFGDDEFGIGTGTNVAAANNCTDTFQRISHMGLQVGVTGSVPFVTLGISPVYMFDGWNRRITYVVDEDLTKESTFESSEGKLQVLDEIGSDLSMIGSPTITEWNNIVAWPSTVDFDPEAQGAALVLISHGKNGHGAERAKGTGIISLTVGTEAGQNEDDNALKASMNGTFRVVPYNLGKTGMNNYSDDIVYYRTKWQLTNRAD